MWKAVKRSARQGWVVDWPPTDWQNGPTGVEVGVKIGSSGALKPDRLGSGAGTRDLGVQTTHEASPWFSLGDAGSTRLENKKTRIWTREVTAIRWLARIHVFTPLVTRDWYELSDWISPGCINNSIYLLFIHWLMVGMATMLPIITT